MSYRPNPKRARQKERTNARRQARNAYMRRRKRQRRGVMLGTLSALLIAGLTIFLIVRPEGDDKAAASPTPVAAACPAADDMKTSDKQYDKAKDQKLDPDKTYIWRIVTTCGTIEVTLDVKNRPKTTNSIAFLAREGFYDGTVFHRIVPDFVIQGGDPTGQGAGGPGYQVEEPLAKGFTYEEGSVAMAKGGADPSGASESQFFIVTSEAGAGKLTPDYAPVGKVTKGMDIVKKIESTGVADGVPATVETRIKRSTIVER